MVVIQMVCWEQPISVYMTLLDPRLYHQLRLYLQEVHAVGFYEASHEGEEAQLPETMSLK